MFRGGLLTYSYLAVQNERDLIGKRPRTHSNSFSHPQSANGTVSPPQSIGTASVSPINSVVGSAPNSYYTLDSQPQPVMSESNMYVNFRNFVDLAAKFLNWLG